MDTLSLLIHGFYVIVIPNNLMACTLGFLLGFIVSIVTGVGTIGTIALLLPFSYHLDTTTALIMFIGIYYGSKYGVLTTSLSLKINGESSPDTSMLIQHNYTKLAFSIPTIAFFITGIFSVVVLTLLVSPLAKLALTFGPPEYFSLAFVGLVIFIKLIGPSTLHSLLMTLVGIMFGTIGLDILSGTSRFTFDLNGLDTGIDFFLLTIGILGLSKIFTVMCPPNSNGKISSSYFSNLSSINEIYLHILSKIPQCILCKLPQKFADSNSTNNFIHFTLMLSLLSLGLPFCACTAIIFSGFIIYGITPGQFFVTQSSALFWGIIASMYISNFLLLIMYLPLKKFLPLLLKLPTHILMPFFIIIVLSGTYSINHSIFDLILVIVFGIIGFLLNYTRYNPIPFIIGVFVGPELEQRLIQTLIIFNGNISEFFYRPISIVILIGGIIFILYHFIKCFYLAKICIK